MTSSSPDDTPRGMECLFSLNRLNVATSRARCAVFIVASHRLLGSELPNTAPDALGERLVPICRTGSPDDVTSVTRVPPTQLGES